jgi:hypothetical protein
LQEIARGESYNSLLLDGNMADFKYEKEFVKLAGKMEKCSDSIKKQTLAQVMKDMASEILKRDYPNIRKKSQPSFNNERHIARIPLQKKKGRQL